MKWELFRTVSFGVSIRNDNEYERETSTQYATVSVRLARKIFTAHIWDSKNRKKNIEMLLI